MEPGGEGGGEAVSGQQRRYECQQEGGGDHNRGVDAGEAGDEGFAAGLAGVGVFHEPDDFRDGALAEGLSGPDAEDTGEVDAAGGHVVAFLDIPGQALAGEGHCVEGGGAFDDGAVEGYFPAGPDHYDFSCIHFFGRDGLSLPAALHLGCVRTDFHQVRDAVAAPALGVTLEQLAYCEEQHDEDRFREFGLRPGQEADAEGTDGGQGHEEVLVEDVSAGNAFCRFFQGAGADEQVGDEIDQEQLPGLQGAVFLDEDGCGEQDGGDGDEGYLPLCAAVGVAVMLVLVLVVVVPFCVFMGVTDVAAVSLAVGFQLVFALYRLCLQLISLRYRTLLLIARCCCSLINFHFVYGAKLQMPGCN